MTVDAQSQITAERHWWPNSSGMPHVKWKTWYGPDPVLVWGRGAVCVFPQDADNPIWVPECLVCAMDFPVQKPEDRTEPRDLTNTGLSTEELLGS